MCKKTSDNLRRKESDQILGPNRPKNEKTPNKAYLSPGQLRVKKWEKKKIDKEGKRTKNISHGGKKIKKCRITVGVVIVEGRGKKSGEEKM